MTIPTWSVSGIIPAIRPGANGVNPDRSPYLASLEDFFDAFCVSRDRLAICRGLLAYRAELHHINITDGFQWLDGSFLEHIEYTESRSPRDVDVVTFFRLPAGESQISLAENSPASFDHDRLKAEFHVDAYSVPLGQEFGLAQVKAVSYWYSMWSHRRDGLWKGFVQVSLDPGLDQNGQAKLDALEASGALV